MTDQVRGDGSEAAQWEAFRRFLAQLGVGPAQLSPPQMLLGNTSVVGSGGDIGHIYTTHPGPWVELWRIDNFPSLKNDDPVAFEYDSTAQPLWPYTNTSTIQSPDRRACSVSFTYGDMPTDTELEALPSVPSTAEEKVYEVHNGTSVSSTTQTGWLYRVIKSPGTASEEWFDMWVLYSSYTKPTGSTKMFLKEWSGTPPGPVTFLQDRREEEETSSVAPYQFVAVNMDWQPQISTVT